MNREGITSFLMELSIKQISVTQLFSKELLQSISMHLGLKRAMIMCFDQNNTFLSWTDAEGVRQSDKDHPYVTFAQNDVVEHVVFYTSKRENLTYFNRIPKLYRSTEIINPADYEDSAYVRFLEDQFNAHYSVTMAFGIYGYIQILFLKSMEEGDFTREELLELENLYVVIAGAYVNFKRHEQAQIISSLKDRVISAEGKDYFITDGFQHILMVSSGAREHLNSMFGLTLKEDIDPQERQMWIPMILRETRAGELPPEGETRQIGNCMFHIYGHEQTYDHGIVEEYFLFTINDGERISAETTAVTKESAEAGALSMLTPSEQKVARLLGEGYTYKQIAAELVVSYHTVKKHVENIYSKLEISSRYQLYELIKQGEELK